MPNPSDKGAEYVADERVIDPGTYEIVTYNDAAHAITAYLEQRLQSVFRRWPARPVVMLSGGVDSILMASFAADQRPNALAVTFSQESSAEAQEEAEAAAEVATILGLEHVVLSPSASELRSLLASTVRRLDTSEPWEVLAGLVVHAVDQEACRRGATGALLSGGGADALFLGGEPLDPQHDNYLEAWDAKVRAKVEANFRRERFIPDFYERLIDDPDRHVQVWQTHAAVDLALSLHPQVTRGEDLAGDKVIFRRLAVQRGIPERLVALQKNPLQVSSGGISGIVDVARRDLTAQFGERTYSDPLLEPLDFTVARLFLNTLLER
ncbi:asparagine synthase-related protein [Corynebacterium breve]|uniref:Asparagine synthase-related protein n=1 Tax=Corynebacterium breve TaxID=3049799 RepID=A0ABY8VI11_9CORY|nr:asparagine synthase-related protein [Corynebacterium breve]WIM68967.1 asparagine synthase-related protein [Corynebacterium breve]